MKRTESAHEITGSMLRLAMAMHERGQRIEFKNNGFDVLGFNTGHVQRAYRILFEEKDNANGRTG